MGDEAMQVLNLEFSAECATGKQRHERRPASTTTSQTR